MIHLSVVSLHMEWVNPEGEPLPQGPSGDEGPVTGLGPHYHHGLKSAGQQIAEVVYSINED